MKVYKDLMLIAIGALAVIVYERYSTDMYDWAMNSIEKAKCKFNGELED